MKYTQIPADTFENIQLNAGILVDNFTPESGLIGNLLGATSGGVTFTATPTYSDYGDDIDNAPKNVKELKKLDSWEATMSGTFVSVTASSIKELVGAADINEENAAHVIPRNDILEKDFKDIWWVGDYSDKNEGTHAGFIAIHLMNALSTGGFSLKSSDKGKGTFDFSYMAHYSMEEPDKVPFELYSKVGE